MNKNQRARLVITIATSALLALQLAAGVTSAGNVTSKDVLIGSSTTDTVNYPSGILDPGQITTGTGTADLVFTPVSVGEDTFFDVWVRNNGGQTLNNITLVVGGDQTTTSTDGTVEDAVDENLRPIKDTSPIPAFPDAFPDGITIVDFDSLPTAVTCSQPTDAEGVAMPDGAITCPIGQLAKGKYFKLTILAHTTTDVAARSFLKATVRVAENANDNGNASNQDTFAAEGELFAAPATCEGVSGFLPAGLQKNFGTSGLDCSGYQSLGLDIPTGATTTSTVLSIATRDGSDPSEACAPGYSCFGDIFELSVNGGATLATGKYMTASIVFYNVPDGYTNVNKLVIIHDGVVITTQNKDKCSTRKVNNCWTGTPTLSGSTFSITIQFTKNGPVRGG